MKNNNTITPLRKFIATAAIAGALLMTASSYAGNATTNWMSFDSGVANWSLNVWGGQGAPGDWSATEDHTGNGGGSLHVVDDYSLGDQLVDLGWMGPNWNSSTTIDMTGWTNIAFYVKWDAANSTEEISGFNGSPGETPQFWGATTPEWTWYTIAPFTIPDAASNGWVKINVPIDPTTPGITANLVLGIKKWTGSGNLAKAAFWVDDITLEGNPAAAIPNPTITSLSKPASGLNLFALTGPYNRNSLQSVNDQAWVGQGGPVSYEFTIAQGVNGSGGAQYQNHIFLVPNPGSESSPDWNEPNVIFLDLEAVNDGSAAWTFRYKTNQPNGNAMMYDNAVVPGFITNATPAGTWKLTFNTANSITMTAPSGLSTNFTIPSDSAALFAGPVKAYFGCQAGNATGVGQQSVLSNIKITGTANPVNDTFTGGAAVNGANWITNATDAGSVFTTPAAAASWLKWSIPDTGFSPQGAASLTGGTWNGISGTKLQVNGQRWQLLLNSDLPSTSAGYYRLIKRVYTQLQVLLPGQTNAPGTVLGYTGTPTPISIAEQGLGSTTVRVYACDASWNIVSGVNSTIHITSTDGSAFLPLNMSMVNGVANFVDPNGVAFQSTGPQTVTATDLSSATVTTPATSAPVTINP